MNNTQQVDAFLLACFLDLRVMVDKKQHGLYDYVGICTHVDELWGTKPTSHLGYLHVARMNQLIPYWPEYSGDESFPVPHSDYTPAEGYYYIDDKWTGEYGAARIRLLEFLIGSLEGEATPEQKALTERNLQ